MPVRDYWHVPIYEFSCTSCGERFEELTAIDATPPCPRCGAPDAKRLISQYAHLRIGLRGGDARRSEARRRDRREREAERGRRSAES